jgi:hypothetical protein
MGACKRCRRPVRDPATAGDRRAPGKTFALDQRDSITVTQALAAIPLKPVTIQAALRKGHAERLEATPGTNSRPKPCSPRNAAGHAGLPASLQRATGRRPASLRARQPVNEPNKPDGGG